MKTSFSLFLLTRYEGTDFTVQQPFIVRICWGLLKMSQAKLTGERSIHALRSPSDVSLEKHANFFATKSSFTQICNAKRVKM